MPVGERKSYHGCDAAFWDDRTFKFEGVEPLFFDDTKSVKEFIQYAFNE